VVVIASTPTGSITCACYSRSLLPPSLFLADELNSEIPTRLSFTNTLLSNSHIQDD
jgi:hypothetical protein